MSGKKIVKGGKSKNSGSTADDEELILKFKQKYTDSGSSCSSRPSQHKVEMQTLYLSKNSENVVLETIKSIRGADFSLRDRSSYRDEGENLSRQYWVDRGHLVVQGGIDYSAKHTNPRISHEHINTYALAKLESYGFHKSHCLEALELTGGDVGVTLEVLLSQYFKLGLSFPFIATNSSVNNGDIEIKPPSSDILQQREEEKCALESIYDSAFEERIANRLWILNLQLDYLLDVYEDNEGFDVQRNNKKSGKKERDDSCERISSRKSKPQPEFCRFFAKGSCKYAQTCRFSHQPVQTPVVVPKEEKEKEKPPFQLEIRFPEGSCYPLEPALVYLTTSASRFPPIASLRLTSRLLQEAQICAKDEIPAVYTIAQLLLDHPDEMVELLRDKDNTFLDPNCALFPPPSLPSDEISETLLETAGETSTRNANTHQQRQQISLHELLREDSNIARRFLEKQGDSRYKKALEGRRQLPAWSRMEIILNAVKKHQVVVVSGETGCGKSTQVPQFLLDDWLLNWSSAEKSHLEIICTQPRRLSAIGVAERVAEERAERIGNTIGYQIRLESKMSSSTRLLFCTTGILLRRLESEPQLNSVSHIIVDEVHERSEESDFLLLILRDLLPFRPDLKVILMSATLNAALFSSYFEQVPTIEIPGRTFPVEQLFLEDILEKTNFALEENSMYSRKMKKSGNSGPGDISSLECELEMADIKGSLTIISNPATRDEHLTITQLYHRYKDYNKLTCKNLYLMDPEKINYDLIETVLTWIVAGEHNFPRKGAILVFLPGMAEISSLHDQLMDHPVLTPRSGKFVLVPLHSTLTSEEQAAVFKKPKPGVRKIVLSTNIAETSVTIDDCVYVVDCGKMKEKRFDSNKNMESLELVWVSQANALQRKGRAGRVMPGVCIHLFTKHRYDYHFLKQPIPELHRVPLEQLLLRIKTLSHFADRNPHEVLGGTLEPPPVESVDSALLRLKDVGALDSDNELTPLGRHLAALPVDVRIGKLMLLGSIFCCVDSALTIAACLSYKSPFVAPFAKKEQADIRKKEFATANSDQLTVLKAYKSWLKACSQSRYAGQVFATENFLSWRTLVTLADIKRQFLELLASIGFIPVEIGGRRGGSDNILSVTGPELNTNGENNRLLAAILCAALYPNVVKVLTPEKSFAPSAMGAVPKQLRADELKFKTRDDGYVFLHPSSVNYTVTHFTSPYLVYQEKVKTSRVFIRDCSMVPVLPLILFSGCSLKVELHKGTFVISLDDGWIKFAVDSHQVAELLQTIRNELVALLKEKIEDPSLNLVTHKQGKMIIATIIHLVTQE
ncbi:putative ATP-dependent RNA helicase DHX57 [Periplaneta americana]|uniref:putative ATP-dependent RNA helicase DHX57 n=1 Tax=Periplaneta americana TaxID=6978 RepID=UPI0037E783DF